MASCQPPFPFRGQNSRALEILTFVVLVLILPVHTGMYVYCHPQPHYVVLSPPDLKLALGTICIICGLRYCIRLKNEVTWM